jgi:hypothetical protein
MKSMDDLFTVIAHCPGAIRTLLDWGSNSLDLPEVAAWCETNGRWYACRARAALAGARAAVFPRRERPPIPTAATRGDEADDAGATVND